MKIRTIILNIFFASVAVAMEPLSWEYHDEGTVAWSNFVYEKYQSDYAHILELAQDAERFCPDYKNLNDNQKMNVWGMLISALVRYESYYDPRARYIESNMGIDPITRKPVASEGLLQLSYQDKLGFPTCQFNWHQDQFLEDKHPDKTILNPFINLDCGMKILASQIRRRGKIIINKGAYWAVIKEGSPHQRIKNIENWVKKLSFCSR